MRRSPVPSLSTREWSRLPWCLLGALLLAGTAYAEPPTPPPYYAVKNVTVVTGAGDPLEEATEVGPLIQEREVDRVHEWVGEAVEAGASLRCGGEKVGTTCYTPTVLIDPPDGAKVSTREVFGPVIAVYPYGDRSVAIKRANQLPFSFQASVFTRDLDVAWDTVNRLKAAAVMVNDHTAFRVDWMPFGGHRQSGLGAGGIGPTMRDMTLERMVVFHSKEL